ncbi:MAG: hypothetical protein PQ975_09940 [Methanobacterium sp.]
MNVGKKIGIVLAGFSSMFIILAIFLTGISFRKLVAMGNFVSYSFISGIIVVIFEALTAYSVANDLFFGGLMEKITIFTFLVWVMVFS